MYVGTIEAMISLIGSQPSLRSSFILHSTLYSCINSTKIYMYIYIFLEKTTNLSSFMYVIRLKKSHYFLCSLTLHSFLFSLAAKSDFTLPDVAPLARLFSSLISETRTWRTYRLCYSGNTHIPNSA